jgi:hypothetical protein
MWRQKRLMPTGAPDRHPIAGFEIADPSIELQQHNLIVTSPTVTQRAGLSAQRQPDHGEPERRFALAA